MCVGSGCAVLQVSVAVNVHSLETGNLKKNKGWIISCSDTSQQISFVHNLTKKKSHNAIGFFMISLTVSQS